MKKWIQAIIIALCIFAMGFAGCNNIGSRDFIAKEIKYNQYTNNWYEVPGTFVFTAMDTDKVGDTTRSLGSSVVVLIKRLN